MKIVFLSFYSGYIHRGMETVVHELASRLGQKHQVTVLQSGPKPTKEQPYTTIQIPLKMTWPTVNDRGITRKLFTDYYSRKIAQFTLKCRSHLNTIQPDIVFPSNGGWQALITKQYAQKHHAKLVIAGQAGLGWDDRWNLKINPDLFVALSQRNLEWADQKSPNVKKQVIPNGVDLEKFQPNTRLPNDNDLQTQIAQLSKPIILCVAGNQDYKRVNHTIQAVSKLGSASLILVRGGDKQTHDPDIKLGKQLLNDRFLVLNVTHDQMPPIYANADLFTLASEPTEAFGIAYVEALASGLPVVATDDKLRREIVGEAGLFVKDPTDHDQYAHQLQAALETKWGSKPRTQAEKFNWEIIAKTYETAFEKLLDS